MSTIYVVDEQDEVIGVKERGEILPSDIYRVSLVWITNSNGEALLAKRSMLKKKNPGVWGPAAAGTVEEGETYDSNVVKEIQEEIGVEVSINDLVKGPKLFVHREHDGTRWFAQSYRLELNKPAEEFIVDDVEVERVAWFSVAEIKRMIKDTPEALTPSYNQWGIFLDTEV